MFIRCDYSLLSDPYCTKSVDTPQAEDFQYYDKDGFELNQAEQAYYAASGHPLRDCLNHRCFQQPWFRLRPDAAGLILDHCLVLHRCGYRGQALEQLRELGDTIPQARLVASTQVKWGFDLALDAIAEDGTVFEVLHIEFDHRDYRAFQDRLLIMEFQIKHTDWQHAAATVWLKRDAWRNLAGFEQNHWKAQFLLGWNRAEYTEKTL